MDDWRDELRHAIRSPGDLRGELSGRAGADAPLEFADRAAPPTAGLPFLMPRGLLARCQPREGDPVLEQFLPHPSEAASLPYEDVDPLSERMHGVAPRLVRQYPSRALLRANSECAAYCRFCYRRSLLGSARGFITDAQAGVAAAALAAMRGLREVLVSGGDPLVASDERIERLLAVIRRAVPGVVVRLCTRTPVVLPSRVTDDLVAMLRRFAPLWVVVHVNHPAELGPESLVALDRFADAGLPVLSQTVLLRGVNDDAETLESLFSALAAARVKPYYLFQGDLAAGTARFRTPLSHSLELYHALRKRCSGLELPRMAVDAPGGLGKVYLPEGVVGRIGDRWILETPDGSRAFYPEEAAGE